jgi:hypothetical protein
MPERIIHRQWRDEQADSRYPFADTASLISNEEQEIPKDIFVDGSLYPVGGEERMYLASIVVAASGITLNVGIPSDELLCSGVFDPLAPPAVIQFTDTWGRAAGVLVMDTVVAAQFQSWDLGTYTFEQDDAEFAASVCIPTPEVGVRGLVTENGDLFTGDVWITGEYGVTVREDTTESTANIRVIRVDMVGDPLYRRILCEGTAQSPLGPVDLFESINYLKTINGLPPDAYGDWKITAGSNEAVDTILRIYPTPEGVRFEAVGELATE